MIGCALSTIGQALKIGVLIILVIQMGLGIGLATAGFYVFLETAPQRPDVEGESGVQASISMFVYAGEIRQYSSSHLARSCLMLVLSGIFLFGMGILGCSSVMSSRPKFLLIFLVASILSSTGSVVLATSLTNYQRVAVTAMYEIMEWSIVNEYDGNLNSNSSWSRLWDLGHVTFHCCGINNYTDFSRSVNLGPVYLGPDIGLSSVTEGFYNLSTPLSCCKVEDGFGLDLINTLKTGKPANRGEIELVDLSCITNATEDNSNKAMGCRKRLEETISKTFGTLTSLGSTTVGLQVVMQIGIILIIYSSM